MTCCLTSAACLLLGVHVSSLVAVPDVFLWLVQLAFQRGYITAEERSRVFDVMRHLGLALWHEVCSLDVLMQVRLVGLGPPIGSLCLATFLLHQAVFCVKQCVRCVDACIRLSA